MVIIYLCVVSFILLAGMVGDNDAKDKQNYMFAFCTCIFAIAFSTMSQYMT